MDAKIDLGAFSYALIKRHLVLPCRHSLGFNLALRLENSQVRQDGVVNRHAQRRVAGERAGGHSVLLVF